MGLDLVELVMRVEEEYEISISDPEAEKIKTPRQLIDYLKRRPEIKERSIPEERIRDTVWEMIEDELTVRREDFDDDSRFVEDMNAS